MDLESARLDTLLLGNILLVTGLVAGMKCLDPGRNAGRIVLATCTILLGFRYLLWRWSSTMAWDVGSVVGLCWPLVFALTETLRQLDCLHAVFTMSVTTDRRGEADRHEARLRALPLAALPWVDVFIPTYAEPREVLYRTLVGTKALDYPRFRIFVLDDGARPWLRTLCAEEGVHYIERRNGLHAKAGNLNNGLAMTRGADTAPYILMLDADFVPYRQFLWRTLGFFADRRIAIVQTPQFFFNPDPAQMNLGSPLNWAEEQRFFFDAMQPSKDAWDMAFCCGSSCVVRRAALESIGGVPEGAVIEDIHLSYALMAKGWITRYLNETLSNGMASETIGEFVGQRVRWAIGCAQALRLPFGPFGRNRLTLLQRLFYLSTITYWTNLIFLLVYMSAPAIYWLGGVSAYRADLAGLAVYQAPYLITSQAFLIWTGRGRIVPAVWEAVQMVFAVDVVRAVYPMLLTGRIRTTRATSKGCPSIAPQSIGV
jgi:cellulose synthase (UDP-forming)